MTSTSPAKTKRTSLRERRRLATKAEISEAALTLFETVGVDNTTVADIAEAADISQRTFFRYFESKELAAFVIDPSYSDVIDGWMREDGKSRNLFSDLLDMQGRGLVAMNSSKSRGTLRRIRRLIRNEPSIRAAAMRIEHAHVERLQEALRCRNDGSHGEMEIAVFSRLASAIMEETVSEWEGLLDKGEPVELPLLYSQVRRVATGAFASSMAAADGGVPSV